MSRAIPAGHEGLIPHLTCERCADAIEFYKKALNLVPTDSPVIDDEKEALRQTITSLGGQL